MKFRDLAWGALVYRNSNKGTQGEAQYNNLVADNEFLQHLVEAPSLEDFGKLRDFLVHFGVRYAPKKLPEQYLHIWSELNPHVNLLRNEELPTCNLSSNEIQNAVRKAFSFLQWPHTWGGDTTASKALHFFNVRLFMMWDSDIRFEYGKFGAQGYLEFLQEIQTQIREILTDFTKLALPESAEDFLSQRLAYPTTRPLTKFLDEYNWITIYRGWPPALPEWLHRLYNIS